MEIIRVKGGLPLKGHVRASGAKNSTTKLLVASLISDKQCVLTNVPDIGDVEATVALCREVGAEIEWDREAGLLTTRTPHLRTAYVPQSFSGANRIPILLMGALLGRTDEEIIIPTVGGCRIGERPVDFHLEALRLLGAEIEYRDMKKEGAYLAHAHDGLTGAIITLPFPSVGATENTLLAAVRARGTTVIKNAALEPEIMDLVLFLQKLGAIITFDADRTIFIQGTRKFYDVRHRIIPDRIEAASLAMAGVATKGRVFVEDAPHQHMVTFLNRLREVGGSFTVHENGIEFFYSGPLQSGVHIETGVHPGFVTDMQQPFVVLLTQATGNAVIHETVYENRFGYTEILKDMGADIELFKQCLGCKPCRYQSQNFAHSLIVKGPTALHGRNIEIPDLRAGFAYVMAALLAKDESLITGLPYLDRGYEKLVEKLGALGADIVREQQEKTDTSEVNLPSKRKKSEPVQAIA